MDATRAITERRSIRAFKPDPLPKEMVLKIMEASIWAPSWANTQSWEFAIVTGNVLKQLSQALIEKEKSGAEYSFDVPRPVFPEEYDWRRVDLGVQLYDALGISRDDKDKRKRWVLEALRFFGAPVLLIVYVDRNIGPYALLDAGLVLQNIMLAAWDQGVGSCPLAAAVRYPDEIRRILKIPLSRVMVCGLALGYADAEHPANKFRSTRQPAESFISWYGF